MGREGAGKAHLLLSHIGLEMTHTVSTHFLLVSTSHVEPRTLQRNWGIWPLAGWTLPSITCVPWKGASWCTDTISGHGGYSKPLCIAAARKVTDTIDHKID